VHEKLPAKRKEEFRIEKPLKVTGVDGYFEGEIGP
jgi:hypothetical protein